jgi:hypothetical protein
MFHRVEGEPSEGPHGRLGPSPNLGPSAAPVRLVDYLAVRSILMYSSMVHMMAGMGREPSSLGTWLQEAPLRDEEGEYSHRGGPHAAAPRLKRRHPSGLAFIDQQAHEPVVEDQYLRTLLVGIGTNDIPPVPKESPPPEYQIWTCFDDRMEGFRRAAESVCEENGLVVETFGVAGFFGVPVKYKPLDGRDMMILAPQGNVPLPKPNFTLVEEAHPDDERAGILHRWKRNRRIEARWRGTAEAMSFLPGLSLLVVTSLAPWSLLQLLLLPFPRVVSWLGEALSNLLSCLLPTAVAMEVMPPAPRTTFRLPFSEEQAAAFLATTLTDIGSASRFAPLVLTIGHGSSSVNNPYFAAYQCGACAGRDGSNSARLIARVANDVRVREILATKHSIVIPPGTRFVGGGVNTSRDQLRFFDVEILPRSHVQALEAMQRALEVANGRHALERCRRFLLDVPRDATEALERVTGRATNPSEIRPELDHAGNFGVVVGRRSLTRGVDLDRRSFLVSYDPFTDDESGTSLQRILTPALIVCSGINLELLFSTFGNDHSAGTKAPLNVVGHLGVMQGTCGDLRTGLPSQMTEMHTPVRAQYVVDAPPARVEAVLARNAQLMRLVRNDWVRLVCRDPFTNRFLEQRQGSYLPVDLNASEPYVPIDVRMVRAHRFFAEGVTARETLYYVLSLLATVCACIVPIVLAQKLGEPSLRGVLTSACGTLLSVPLLIFSRRFIHGDTKFALFCICSACLVTGFNLVAMARDLKQALGGWSLVGFASTFLIGLYNERMSAYQNATFAFGAYCLSDLCLLSAAVLSEDARVVGDGARSGAPAAAALIAAALLKSSQFPLCSLLPRSMEGPTPASALGYGGLSPHLGVVLLASMEAEWSVYAWARAVVGAVGALTAVMATLIAQTRADRKGALAYAISASVGQIYIVLALGYVDIALVVSFGHAAYRMKQILLAPDVLASFTESRAQLNGSPDADGWGLLSPPSWLYSVSWALRRLDLEISSFFRLPVASTRTWPRWNLSFPVVMSVSVGILLVSGLPFTPLTVASHRSYEAILLTRPMIAITLGLGRCALAVLLVRILLSHVMVPAVDSELSPEEHLDDLSPALSPVTRRQISRLDDVAGGKPLEVALEVSGSDLSKSQELEGSDLRRLPPRYS